MNSMGAEGFASKISVATSVPLFLPGSLESIRYTSADCLSISVLMLFAPVYEQ